MLQIHNTPEILLRADFNNVKPDGTIFVPFGNVVRASRPVESRSYVRVADNEGDVCNGRVVSIGARGFRILLDPSTIESEYKDFVVTETLPVPHGIGAVVFGADAVLA